MNKQMKMMRELEQGMEQIQNVVGQEGGVIAGSVYAARIRCGRKACRCMQSDYRHEIRCISFREDGGSRTRTLPDELAEEIQDKTVSYRQAKQLRRAMAKLSSKLIGEVDRLIAAAAQKGQQDMLSALTKARKEAK